MMVGDEEWYQQEEDRAESGEVQAMCPSESPIVPRCIQNVRRGRLFDAKLMTSVHDTHLNPKKSRIIPVPSC